MKIKNNIYIGSFDCITCSGDNCEEFFQAICCKKKSISLNKNYIKNKIVAIGEIKNNKSFEEILVEKCDNVLKKSNLKNFHNTLLVVGTSEGGIKNTEESYFKNKNYKKINYKKHFVDIFARLLDKQFDFKDDITFSTACTSSANALGYAKEMIDKNVYDNVLVVGLDNLCHTTVCGFFSLGVLSSTPCKPFDKKRDGMNVSEAIGFVLLQKEKNKTGIILKSVAYSSDAFHMTQPHSEGEGAVSSMEKAISKANLKKSEIDFIIAHGTGTIANDKIELKAIEKLFEKKIPYVVSIKSIVGHTLGAAGVINLIAGILSLEKQIIIPNSRLEEVENKKINFSFQVENKKIINILCNSFAFGGNNTSMVVGLSDDY